MSNSNKAPLTVETVRAMIAAGFATKVAKKNAGEKLNRVWGKLRDTMRNEGVRVDLPLYAHEVRNKAIAALDGFAEFQGEAEYIRDTYAALKATEVVKAAKKLDRSKVIEKTAAEATVEGIDFIDHEGERRGYCYCCGRVGFKLNDAGRLSRHGYNRPGIGYDIGGCYGTRQTPAETLALAIEWTAQNIVRLDDLLATDLVAFSLKQAKIEGDKARETGSRWRLAQAERDTAEIMAGTSTRPEGWRTYLTTDRKSNVGQLANLEAVQARLAS